MVLGGMRVGEKSWREGERVKREKEEEVKGEW